MGGTGVPPVNSLTGQRPIPPIPSQALRPFRTASYSAALRAWLGKKANMTWNPNLYLKFQAERTQPALDLYARIEATAPERVADLGCGPGNSTAVLRSRRPGLRIFVDRLELRTGAAWQQHIFDSLEESRKVICVFSPEYLASKVCKEEFNIALFRHREAADGVILPVYLLSAALPTYMKLVQYEDVREGDRLKMAEAAVRLLRQL